LNSHPNSLLFANLCEVLEQKTTAENKKTSAENRREKQQIKYRKQTEKTNAENKRAENIINTQRHDNFKFKKRHKSKKPIR